MVEATGKSALTLSGGGARGAYQVGVLKALAERIAPGTQPFSILTGTSVGALNASVLATAPHDFPEGVRRLEAIWRALHCDQVFVCDGATLRGRIAGWSAAAAFGWAGRSAPPSLLDNSPLRTLLEAHVDFEALNAHLGINGGLNALAITASSYRSGRALTFFYGEAEITPWERARRVGIRARLTADHVMASSALPFIFPAIEFDGRWCGDGALRELTPLSAAIHLGADHIMTIGARDLEPDPETNEEMGYPSVGYLSGQMLDILFNDHAEADIDRARRMNLMLEALPEDARAATGMRPLDLLSVIPSQDIRPIAGQHLSEMPGALRILMRAIGGLKAPYVLPSYLMFEPGYISALIALGEKDGAAAFRESTFPAAVQSRP